MFGQATPQITPQNVQAALEKSADVQIIDVREEWEWNDGHIDAAIHMPLNDLPHRMTELDAEKPIVVICHLGQRSDVGATYLIRSGYSKAVSMTGGMDAWERIGYPTVQ